MSSLFVQEEEDDISSPAFITPEPQTDEKHNEKESNDEDDDPIISEIPIILKNTESTNHELYALQFANRPKNRQLTGVNRVLESRLKPESGFIEVDIPVDTTKFYDASKAEEWGGVSRQSLQGVLLDLEGYFVGSVKDGELLLLPLDKVAQLRTSLKHIDKESNDKKEIAKLENNSNRNGTSQNDIQVVQMTVKNTADNIPRLGGALLARKKVDQENFELYKWNDLNDNITKEVRDKLIKVDESLKIELEPLSTSEEYLDLLVQETIV